MDEAALVRVLQARRRLRDVLRGHLEGHTAVAVERLLKRLALDVLHHEVRHFVVPRHVEDADDVRVVERRSGAGLAQEPLQGELLILALARRENLDRDFPVQVDVLSEVDGTHPATTEQVVNYIRPDTEALVPPNEHLRGLEACEEARPHEGRRRLRRFRREVFRLGERLESLGGQNAAPLDEIK